MILKVDEIIKCNKCGCDSELNNIEVKDNKMIMANYMCKCDNKTNILIEWIDTVTKKELQRKKIKNLLEKLKNMDKNKILRTDIYDKTYVENSFGSDRGIYTAMYISTTNDENKALTVEKLINLLNKA